MLRTALYTVSILFFALGLLFCAAPAAAQEDEARMKELVKQGAQAFSEKRFGDSAELFEQAYEAKANPTLLKNAMVAWYKANRCGKAVEVGARFYREARDAGALEAKDQSEIQTVVSCSLNLAQQRIDEEKFGEAEDLLFAATSAGPSDQQTERIATMREELREQRAAAGQASVDPEDPETPPGGGTVDSDDGIAPLALAGWGVTGIGVAGLIGSVIYALTANGAERNAANCITDGVPDGSGDEFICAADELGLDPGAVTTANYNELIRDPIANAKSNSQIFYVVSGTITAVGAGILVYHYFFASRGEEADAGVTVAPVVSPDHVGAQLLWRF